MSVPMEPEAILLVRGRLTVLAQFVRATLTLDELDDFIRTCEGADSIGPVLDPTMWMRSRDDIQIMLRHAQAVRAYRKALDPEAVPA